MNILCVNDRCCLREDELSELVNSISTLRIYIRNTCIHYNIDIDSMIRDIEASRNALIKVCGGIRALRTRFKNVKHNTEVSDVESVANTLVNILNRLVEVRNLLTRIRDEIEEIKSSAINNLIDKIDSIVISLDKNLFIMSLIGLHLTLRLSNLSRDNSGKLASAIGTALFISLLNIYRNDLRKSLMDCI